MAGVRLIDAIELKRSICQDTRYGTYGEFMDGSEVSFTSNEVHAMIDDAPTISPDSRRPKGRWEKVPPYTAIDGGWYKAVICSECKTHYVSDGNTPWRMHNFCAHCGADMRGDETDDTR